MSERHSLCPEAAVQTAPDKLQPETEGCAASICLMAKIAAELSQGGTFL